MIRTNLPVIGGLSCPYEACLQFELNSPWRETRQGRVLSKAKDLSLVTTNYLHKDPPIPDRHIEQAHFPSLPYIL